MEEDTREAPLSPKLAEEECAGEAAIATDNQEDKTLSSTDQEGEGAKLQHQETSGNAKPGTSRQEAATHAHARLHKSASPSVDRESCSPDVDEKASSAGSERSHARSQSPQVPSTICFFSGNPSVETTEGIIHLYKDK